MSDVMSDSCWRCEQVNVTLERCALNLKELAVDRKISSQSYFQSPSFSWHTFNQIKRAHKECGAWGTKMRSVRYLWAAAHFPPHGLKQQTLSNKRSVSISTIFFKRLTSTWQVHVCARTWTCLNTPIEFCLRELALSFHHVSSGDGTQAVRLGGKDFHRMSHLEASEFYFLDEHLVGIIYLMMS